MVLLRDAWEKDIQALTPSRAGELYEAILTLGTWPMFKKTFFNDRGLGTLALVLKQRYEHPKRTIWHCANCCEYLKEKTEAERCPECGSHKVYKITVCAHRFKYMGEGPCTGSQVCIYCGVRKDEVADCEL